MNLFFRNKYLRWISYLILFLLLVIIMDKLIMPWYVRLGDETELPEVVEMELKDAQKKLKEAGFEVIISDSIYNANLPAGVVVEQMPLPLTTVKTGRHVYLKVSIGEKPIIMPNLFYKSPRDAKLILKSFDLPIASMMYEYSDISLDGVIISQSYPAGQVVKRGTPITLTVSLGPFPKQPTIPDLSRKSLDAAKKQLKLLGLRNIHIVYEERDDILPETVLSQSLKKGTLISKDLSLELVVSKLKPKGEN